MKERKFIEPIDVVAMLMLLLMAFGILLLDQDTYLIPDLRFLHNRALRIYECLASGEVPYFYYNDFNGVGYGTAFFYGHLLLYPFCYLAHLGIEPFLKAYYMVTLFLTYTGTCFFSKRFTKNYKFVGLMYSVSGFSIISFYCSGLLANLFAVAISFFFLGCCIDFFHDGKSYVKASILYFLLLNTHLSTAYICFFGSVLIMLFYFKKSRIKDYAKFALTTVLFCSYFIVNFFYHSGILTRMSDINAKFFDTSLTDSIKDYSLYISKFPFFGLLDVNLIKIIFGVSIDSYGFKLVDFAVFVCLIVYFAKRKHYTKRELVSLILILVGFILSIKPVWSAINSVHLVSFQFPIRFAPYLVLILLMIGFRYMKAKKVRIFLIVICTIDLILCPLCISFLDEEYDDLFCQIENGEYLDESFIMETSIFSDLSSKVSDQYDNTYDYELTSRGLAVDLSSNTNTDTIIRVPKIWYKGYVAYTDTESFECKMGYSQFIEISIGDCIDTLTVEYHHPIWLIVWNFICLLLVISSIIIVIVKSRRKFAKV